MKSMLLIGIILSSCVLFSAEKATAEQKADAALEKFRDALNANPGTVLVLKSGGKVKMSRAEIVNRKLVIIDAAGKKYDIGPADIENSIVPVEKVAPDKKQAATPADPVEEHWKNVTLEVKPNSEVITWKFTPGGKRTVKWKVSVGEGVANERYYDIYFYNGSKRIEESIEIIKDMKRNTSKDGSALVNPMDVTRIEVKLIQKISK